MSARQTIARRILAAAGALGLAGAVVAGTAHPVEETSASWTNFEYGQANVTAGWPVAYAGVQADTVKMFKNGESPAYSSSYRWQMQNYGLPVNVNNTASRTIDVAYRQSGTIDGSTPNLPTIGMDGQSGKYHNWYGYPDRNTSTDKRVGLGVQPCMFISPNYQASAGAGACDSTSGTISAATMYQPGFGFSIYESPVGSGGGIAFINAYGLKTGVTCTATGATATAPEGTIDISHELGGTNPYPAYSTSGALNWYNVWTTGQANGQLSSLRNTYYISDLTRVRQKVRPMVRTIARGASTGDSPYALSEIGLYVETYIGSNNFRSKFYFLLSRSECGVKNVTSNSDRLPPDRQPDSPAIPAFADDKAAELDGFPGFDSTGAVTARMAQAHQAATQESAAVSTTSPVETSTGVDTTTSAPPTTGAGSTTASSSAASTEATRESTSAVRTSEGTTQPSTEVSSSSTQAPAPSSSAAPAIPAEPGKLPSGAKKCGTVATGEGTEANAVIAAGTECDTSARRDATDALAAYIADGTQDARWKVFASDDATRDGWRWAAIDQETGQIVYVL